ncbi:hypothetical protein BH18ACT1_BH18ACT1_03690 [soil metagenome]
MKQFACGDVVPGCAATFERPTEDELMTDIAQHAAAEHGMQDIPPAVVDQVRAGIKDV